MKLYILRHTEVHNPNDIDYYRTDLDLSERGKKQAQELVPVLSKNHYDAIIVSPLKRTHQTVAPFLKTLKNPKIIIENLIIDRDLGAFTGKSPHGSFRRYCQKNNLSRITTAPNRGESFLDVIARVQKFLDLLKKNYSDKSVLVVAHGNVIRCIESLIKKIDPEELYEKIALADFGELKEFDL